MPQISAMATATDVLQLHHFLRSNMLHVRLHTAAVHSFGRQELTLEAESRRYAHPAWSHYRSRGAKTGSLGGLLATSCAWQRVSMTCAYPKLGKSFFTTLLTASHVGHQRAHVHHCNRYPHDQQNRRTSTPSGDSSYTFHPAVSNQLDCIPS